jgi:hypothetical protein
MAKQEFLDSFRTARNLFFHPRVVNNATSLDSKALGQMNARSAIWLTPKSVQGFNADDFLELGVDRQNELQTAVREFLDVANKVGPKEPATPEQLDSARLVFTTLLGVLQPYLPSPEDGDKVEEALKRIEFPPWVVNWDYELGSDQDGSAAVWVNFFADDSIAPRKEFGRFASRMTTRIRDALAAVGSHRWPYVRMRTAVEHKTA